MGPIEAPTLERPRKLAIEICMGSACHQHGVYELLPLLRQLIADHRAEADIELKGAFCLGPCTRAIVLKCGARTFTNASVSTLPALFEREILPCLLEQR